MEKKSENRVGVEPTKTTGRSQAGRDVLPVPPARFHGRIGTTHADSEPDVAEMFAAPKGAPNVADHPARRRRVRAPEHVRRPDPDQGAAAPRRRGRPVQPLPHDGALLSDTRGHADRAQSPLGAHRGHPGARDGLPRLRRRASQGFGDDRHDPARQRLQHRGLRQVAQHAGLRDQRGRPVRSLAHRARVRLLLGIPGRRGEPVAPAALREHDADRNPHLAGLAPLRSHGGQGHRMDRPAEGGRPGQAVLHVLGARRRTRASPRRARVG